jgi:5'-phosphate synthase pdxT subunit
MIIGVLALQGAFIEHQKMLAELHVKTQDVRLPEHLESIDGLIIPGGESTTIGKLAEAYHLIEPIQEFAMNRPIWGTCAGMIFMAKKINHASQQLLKIMDIHVKRNAFGRQVDSFLTPLDIPEIGGSPFPGVFIRAPAVVDYGPEVRVVCTLSDGRIVAVKEKHWLATSFHPELTEDNRFHKFFLNMIRK